MGLAICRRIAARHGGTIAAHATVGSGAIFVVTLPRSAVLIDAELPVAEVPAA